MVIPEPELNERPAELLRIADLPLIQLLLQCSEEPFDSSILPGTSFFDTLMPDAYKP